MNTRQLGFWMCAALALVGLPVHFWMRWRHPVTAAPGAAPPP